MAEERIQERLAALLAADAVSNSRMMSGNELGTLSGLTAFRQRYFDPKTEQIAGRNFKITDAGAGEAKVISTILPEQLLGATPPMKKKFTSTDGRNTLSFIFAAMVSLAFTAHVSASDSFERVGLRFEQNFTDKDVEVVFDVVTRTLGLAALQVTAPDGRIVIDFKSPGSKFGIRHLTLETPEPTNNGNIQADFPEGIYRFKGTTTNGDKLLATATLSHKLPPVPEPTSPQPGQEDVPITGVEVQWKPIPGVVQFIVILEDEKTGQDNTAIVSGTKNVFTVPTGFLAYGGTYKVEIGAVAGNGNRTFMEYEIMTMKRP